MIILIRLAYFLGPILCLALVLLPKGSVIAKGLWAFAAFMVAIHWYSFLTATGENSEYISHLWAGVWTLLLATTLIANQFREVWKQWHANPNIAKWLAALACSTPSIIAFFALS